jgi:hypothetical protein
MSPPPRPELGLKQMVRDKAAAWYSYPTEDLNLALEVWFIGIRYGLLSANSLLSLEPQFSLLDL